ncbi:hypothetical protein [Agromyces soli]|uniref:Uncharacterized protein n=1 Tax=Agromyces soli TaxID=659012 RepID=A0ABY4AT26_9MICO|nr:hypothetical protein [Agromyces soli]UOE26312.1 hypothetical protein MTP13_00610 [Agromyces soli]
MSRRDDRPATDQLTNVLLTVFVLILMFVVAGAALIAGALIGVDAMGCTGEVCAVVKRSGSWFAMLTTAVALIVGMIVAIVRLARRGRSRRPLVTAMGVMVGAVLLGALGGAVGSALDGAFGA